VEEIGNLIRSSLVSIDSKRTVSEAILYFQLHRVEALLVEVSNKYQGILAKSTLLQRIHQEGLDPKTKLIYEVMEQPIPSLDRSTSVQEASQYMCNHNTRCLAVTEGGRIVGVISSEDMFADYLNRYK